MKNKQKLELIDEMFLVAGLDLWAILKDYMDNHRPPECERPVGDFEAFEGITDKGIEIINEWTGKSGSEVNFLAGRI